MNDTCPYCGTRPLPNRKNPRTCGDPGCQQKHQRRLMRDNMRRRRAAHPDSDRDATFTCRTCGEEFRGRKRDATRYCSRTCRDLANIESGQLSKAGAAWSAKAAAARKPEPTCCELTRTTCKICSTEVLHDARQARAYCGTDCRRRAMYAKTDRPWRYKAERLHERDRYVCWLCGERTSDAWAAGDPLAPTLDHVVPRSRGGTHEDDNLRTAHAICNSYRSDRATVTRLDVYEMLERTSYATA